jgi:hypothetical protein
MRLSLRLVILLAAISTAVPSLFAQSPEAKLANQLATK